MRFSGVVTAPRGKSAVEYGSSGVGEDGERWERSTFYQKLNRTAPLRLWLMTTGGDEVRRRIGQGDPTDFYLLDGLKSEGHTDYVALVHRFVSDGVIGEMDCAEFPLDDTEGRRIQR